MRRFIGYLVLAIAIVAPYQAGVAQDMAGDMGDMGGMDPGIGGPMGMDPGIGGPMGMDPSIGGPMGMDPGPIVDPGTGNTGGPDVIGTDGTPPTPMVIDNPFWDSGLWGNGFWGNGLWGGSYGNYRNYKNYGDYRNYDPWNTYTSYRSYPRARSYPMTIVPRDGSSSEAKVHHGRIVLVPHFYSHTDGKLYPITQNPQITQQITEPSDTAHSNETNLDGMNLQRMDRGGINSRAMDSQEMNRQGMDHQKRTRNGMNSKGTKSKGTKARNAMSDASEWGTPLVVTQTNTARTNTAQTNTAQIDTKNSDTKNSDTTQRHTKLTDTVAVREKALDAPTSTAVPPTAVPSTAVPSTALAQVVPASTPSTTHVAVPVVPYQVNGRTHLISVLNPPPIPRMRVDPAPESPVPVFDSYPSSHLGMGGIGGSVFGPNYHTPAYGGGMGMWLGMPTGGGGFVSMPIR